MNNPNPFDDPNLLTMSIDFEFNKASEREMHLVCCSIVNSSAGEVGTFWLNDGSGKRDLENYLTLHKDSHVFIAHQSTAEARSFLSLCNIDPTVFTWFDTFILSQQLTNKCDKFKYGTYFDKEGVQKFSVRPSFNAKLNKGKDNTEIGKGYAPRVARHLGRDVGLKRKDLMRDVIIYGSYEDIENNRAEISEYCESDVIPLRELASQMLVDLHSVCRETLADLYKYQIIHAQFAVVTATMEREGIPIDINQVGDLQFNYNKIKDAIVQKLVDEVYPFFEKEKKTKLDRPEWVFKYSAFCRYLEESGLSKAWPKTKPSKTSPYGKYKTDSDTFKTISHPGIKALSETNKLLTQLRWFRPEGGMEFMSRVGSDGCSRPYLGTFKTQTSRNAPAAKHFILAMSSWLRCFIVPPKGEVVIAKDYGSQEFAIAAICSGDKNMMKAYESGDPYLYLMKLAKAVPMEADNYLCKNPPQILTDAGYGKFDHGVSEEIEEKVKSENPTLYKKYKDYIGYKLQRMLGKATTLSLQFGAGALSLAEGIALNTGKDVDLRQAKKLVKFHKDSYRVFWSWAEKQLRTYKTKKYLILPDGWMLLGDNDKDLSVKNFPVQGRGGSIMRRASIMAYKLYGLRIMCPLHDALYIRCADDEETIKFNNEALEYCMQKAFQEMLNTDFIIRIDTDLHEHHDVWIEEKGEDNYKFFSKLLNCPESADRKEREMLFNKFYEMVA